MGAYEPERAAALARELVAQGFDTIKVKVGTGNPTSDVTRVRAVREAEAARQGLQKARCLSNGGDDASGADDQPVLDIADGPVAVVLRVAGKPQQPPAQRRVREGGVAVCHDPPFFVPRPAPPVWP